MKQFTRLVLDVVFLNTCLRVPPWVCPGVCVHTCDDYAVCAALYECTIGALLDLGQNHVELDKQFYVLHARKGGRLWFFYEGKGGKDETQSSVAQGRHWTTLDI